RHQPRDVKVAGRRWGNRIDQVGVAVDQDLDERVTGAGRPVRADDVQGRRRVRTARPQQSGGRLAVGARVEDRLRQVVLTRCVTDANRVATLDYRHVQGAREYAVGVSACRVERLRVMQVLD